MWTLLHNENSQEERKDIKMQLIKTGTYTFNLDQIVMWVENVEIPTSGGLTIYTTSPQAGIIWLEPAERVEFLRQTSGRINTI